MLPIGHERVVLDGTAIRENGSGNPRGKLREEQPFGQWTCCPAYRGEFERLRHVAISFHHHSVSHCRVRTPNGQ